MSRSGREPGYKIDRSIIGQKFGFLKVIDYDHTCDTSHTSYWKCECKCGNVKVIRRDMLMDGRAISCGCMRNRGVPKDEIESYRRHALSAAKDFHYGKDVECALKKATGISEMERIMVNARHEKFK